MSAEDSIVDLNGSGLRLSLSHGNLGDEGKGVDVRIGSHEPLIPKRKKRGVGIETSAWLLYKWERMTIVSCPECGGAVGVRSDRDCLHRLSPFQDQGNTFRCTIIASKL